MDPAMLALILAGEQIVERWLTQKQPPGDAEMEQLAAATAAARKAAEAGAESLRGRRGGTNDASI